MDAPIFLNIVQLSMRDSGLSLQKPLTQQTPNLSEICSAIQSILESENAEKIIFSPPGPSPKMRVELTATDLRWMEKSDLGIQDYQFFLKTQKLLYNKQSADQSFLPGFVQKIEIFIRDIQHNAMRVLVKPKESGGIS